MLPAPLTSQYQQYKKDTDDIAGWLASNALKLGFVVPRTDEVDDTHRSHGDVSHLVQVSTDENPVRQTLQHDCPRTTSKSPRASRNATQRHVVNTGALVPLAAYIFTSHGGDKTVLVPASLVHALDRVIAVEKHHGSTLFSQGGTDAKGPDNRASYPVGVYEEVRKALGPLVGSHEKAEMAELEAHLAALHLEAAQVFLNVPGLTYQRPPTKDDEDATYEANIPSEGAFLAFVIMMDDVCRLRSMVKWIWKNYLGGHIELASASLATNTAMELARDLMEEVMPLLSQYDTVSLIVIHFKHLCRSRGVPDTDTKTNHPKDNFNYDLYDIAEETLLNAGRMLEFFLPTLNRGQILSPTNEYEYDPASDRSKKSGRQKFKEDKCLLLEFLSELTIVNVAADYIIRDGFQAGLDEMMRTKRMPLYLVFAAQVYLDIHHELREKAADSFKTLFREAISAQVDLARHLDFHKDVKVEKTTKRHNELLRDSQKWIEAVTKAELHEAKVRHFRLKGLSLPKNVDRHLVLKRSPLMSGLILHMTRIGMHTAGVRVANIWGSIMYTCHLYHAYRSVRARAARLWPDMELCEAIFGTSNFYTGGRPKTLNQFTEEFFLQLGVTSKSMNKAKARGGCRIPRMSAIMASYDPYVLKDRDLVSKRFMDYALYGCWTREAIETIMSLGDYTPEASECSSEFEFTPEGSSGTLEGSDDSPEASSDSPKGARDACKDSRDAPKGSCGTPMLSHEDSRDASKGNTPEVSHVKNTSGTGKMGDSKNEDHSGNPTGQHPGTKPRPEELVKAFALALQHESVDIGFPLLHFHRVCWNMLRKVHDACRVDLFKACGPGYLDEEVDLPFVVGYIFMDAVGVHSGRPDPTMLVTAARVMDEELQKEGMGDAMISVLRKDKGLRP